MFVNKLNEFIKKIELEGVVDEWYLSNFIDENISLLSSEEAFELSSFLIEFIKNDVNSDCLYELLEILSALQRQSDTVQKPLALLKYPDIFNEIISSSSEEYILCMVNRLSELYGQ